VVLTASSGSFPGLIEELRAIPVPVEEHPLLDFAAPLDWGPLDAALDRLPSYRALAFTSPRAARAFVTRLQQRERRPPGAGMPEIWVAGDGTARALEGALGQVRAAPEREVGRSGAAAALARAMREHGVQGPVLFPCGDHRRDELPARLRDAGVEVDEVVCYRTVLAGEQAARDAAGRGSILIVGSPSVADLLARACPPGLRPALIAVGPTTGGAARAAGWPPAGIAPRASASAIVGVVRAVLAQS
jgi:uroporphyrinogen-III synthase